MAGGDPTLGIYQTLPNATPVEIRNVTRLIKKQPKETREMLTSMLGLDGVPAVIHDRGKRGML